MAIIPFDDRDGFIWLDGKLVEWRQARIHVICHGLHYGSAVFEGERAYEGNIFKSHEHSERLIRSANLIGMEVPWTAYDIDMAKESGLKANRLTDAYIRPVAWRGSEQMGIAARQTKTHMAVACWEWPSYFSPELREKGISLMTSRWRKPAPDTEMCIRDRLNLRLLAGRDLLETSFIVHQVSVVFIPYGAECLLHPDLASVLAKGLAFKSQGVF